MEARVHVKDKLVKKEDSEELLEAIKLRPLLRVSMILLQGK